MRSLAAGLHLLTLAGLAALWGGSWWVYPDLPAEIPMHYGLTGVADRFAPATLGRWLILPVVATLTAGLTYGGALLIPHMAEAQSTSSPAMDALNAAGRRRLLASSQRLMYGITALVVGLFGAAQIGNYMVATRSLEALPGGIRIVLVGCLVAILGLTLGHVAYQRRLAERLARRPEYTRSTHPSD